MTNVTSVKVARPWYNVKWHSVEHHYIKQHSVKDQTDNSRIIVIKPWLAGPYSLTWPHKGGAKEAVYPEFMGPAGARKDSWQFYFILVTTVGISGC